MKVLFSFLAIVISLAFGQIQVDADQQDSVKVFQLNEVMVSATRSHKDIDAIGRSVDVIGKQQMGNFLFQHSGDLLSSQTGIFVVGAAQNPGMNQTLFMRGAASHQTAVMVDGVRLTDPSTVNDVIDITELSLLGTDRIEIVRGTHSTLYGSSAVGGVINMLSHNEESAGLHLTLTGTAGTIGSGTSLHSEKILMNYTHTSGVYVNGGIENYFLNGVDATIDTIPNGAAFKNRDRDDFEKQDYLGKIGYQDSNSSAYFSYKTIHQIADIDKSAFIDDDNYTLRFSRDLVTYGGSHRLMPEMELKYIGGYSVLKRNARNDSTVVDAAGNTDHTFFTDDYSGSSMTNEIQANIAIGGFSTVIGAGLYRETMNIQSYLFSWSAFGVYESKTNLDTLDLSSTVTNIFIRTDIEGSSLGDALNKFSIGLGGRINNHTAYGSNTTIEINPSYRLSEKGMMYGVYSTGFAAPSLYQLYSPNTYYASPVKRGNKLLQPEKSSMVELGFKYALNDGTRFTAALFSTTVSNSIEYVYLWDGTIGIDTLGNNWARDDYRGDTYLNVGTVTQRGIECSIQSTLTHNLTVTGNITYVAGTLQFRPNDIAKEQTANHHVQLFNNGAFLNRDVESNVLTRRPVTANLSATYRLMPEFSLRLDGRIVGERHDVYYDAGFGPYGALGTVPVASYFLVDFSQQYHISKNVVVNGRIENLFNRQYSDIKGFSTRGRSVYVNLKYEL